MQRDPNKFWNPYLAGVALGLVLLTGLVVLGKGLGGAVFPIQVGVETPAETAAGS